MPTTLYLDNSTLRATASCSTYAAVRYGLGFTAPEERAPIKAGLAIHEALATLFTQRHAGAAATMLEAQYRAWAEAHVPPDDRLGWPNVRAVFSAWLDAHPLSGLPFTVPPAMVEVGAQAQLTDDGRCLCGQPLHDGPLGACPDGCTVVYCGRLDAVGRTRDGRWWAVDAKSTGQMTASWLDQFRDDAQMNGYVWLLQQHLGEPVAGAFIVAIELSKLPDSSRRCTRHATVYAECGSLHLRSDIVMTERSPEAVAEWRKGALALARRYRELRALAPTLADAATRVRMTGAWHGVCPRCELRAWCRGGRRMDMADALLVHEPWEPFARTGGAAPPTEAVA